MTRAAMAATTRHDGGELRLAGVSLLAARLCCVVVCVYSLVLFVTGLQFSDQTVRSACATASSCLPGRLTTQQITTLHGMGIAVEMYAVLSGAFILLTSLVWFVVAAIVFARKSDHPMVLPSSRRRSPRARATPPTPSREAISCGTCPHRFWAWSIPCSSLDFWHASQRAALLHGGWPGCWCPRSFSRRQ